MVKLQHSVTEISPKRYFRPENILWYCPLILSVLFSFYCAGATTLDSGHYIKRAFFFTRGEFDLLFRPGFIFLLGGTFKIFGSSVWAGTVLIRLFFAANVYIIFFITRSLYDKKVAFAASMAVFTSYYLHFLSHRILLDNVHPFFVLLSIFLSLKAVDRRSPYLAAGAGVAFIYAYLVKMTAVLFLPFPIMTAVFRHSFKIRWSNLREAVITTVIGSAGIVLYQILARDGVKISHAQHHLDHRSSQMFDMLFGGGMVESFSIAAGSFLDFWHRFLFLDDWLGWLFAVSWLWLIIRSVKSNSCRSVLAIFILFIPAAIYLGLRYLRLGQAGVFLLVTFIPVGVILRDLASGLIKMPIVHSRFSDYRLKLASSAILVSLTLIVCTYQVWHAVEDSEPFFEETYLGRILDGKSTQFVLEGTFDAKSHKAARIIKRHAQTGDIVQTGMVNFWPIQFFTGYTYHYQRKGAVKLLGKIPTLKEHLADSLPSGKIKGRLLYLWPNKWARKLTQKNQAGEIRIRYIDESNLLRHFRSKKSVFVALDNRWAHIGEFLKLVPGVDRLSENPAVYHIKKKKFTLPNDFGPPRVAIRMGELLAELRAVHPENYRILRNKFFPDFFNFMPQQVDAMADLNEEAAGVIFMHKHW